MALLEIENLTKHFFRLSALSRVSLSVEPGELLGIIGPNGSGKTTLFNCVTGVLRPSDGHVRFRGEDITGRSADTVYHRGIARTFQLIQLFPEMTVFGLLPARQGRVLLDGEDITNRPPAELLRRGMAYVPQGRNVFPLMTVEENLLLGAYTRPHSAELDGEVQQLYETFPALREARRKRAGDLSGGQQQMLEMARALLLKPRLILLDEPTAGVNPTMIKNLVGHIRELNARGYTFVVIEHNMEVVMSLCRRIVVLSQGERIAEGTPAEVSGNPLVLDAYFGR